MARLSERGAEQRAYPKQLPELLHDLGRLHRDEPPFLMDLIDVRSTAKGVVSPPAFRPRAVRPPTPHAPACPLRAACAPRRRRRRRLPSMLDRLQQHPSPSSRASRRAREKERTELEGRPACKGARLKEARLKEARFNGADGRQPLKESSMEGSIERELDGELD